MPSSLNINQPNELRFMPNMPGFNLPPELAKTKFNKKHQLNYCNGYQQCSTPTEPRQAPVESEVFLKQVQKSLQFGDRPSKRNLEPVKLASEPFMPARASNDHDELPKMFEYDGVVLTFSAYLRENIPDGIRAPTLGVHGSESSEYTIRRVVIRYFMEDDSVAITEPAILNSGLVAGPVLKRQTIGRRDGAQTDAISVADLVVGQDVKIFGKSYHVASCDAFTKKFLHEKLNRFATIADEMIPTDPYVKARQIARDESHQVKHKDATDAWLKEKYRRFVSDDGKVLRFYCDWDDSKSLYGDIRPYELHYYLFDDTVEVVAARNSTKTRDTSSLLVRRQILPRKITGLHDLAGTTPLGTDIDVNPPHVENFYSWKDFKIGSRINVLGRDFIIKAIDSFTREFYLSKGMHPSDLEPIESSVKSIGQVLQTNSNPITLAEDQFPFKSKPAPRPKNIYRQLKTDGKTLVFSAKMVGGAAADDSRKFTISFRLSEELISVFEPAERQSGNVGGGKMADRALCVNPVTGNYYCDADFYVGATISVYGRKYLLEVADDFSTKWIAENSPPI